MKEKRLKEGLMGMIGIQTLPLSLAVENRWKAKEAICSYPFSLKAMLTGKERKWLSKGSVHRDTYILSEACFSNHCQESLFLAKQNKNVIHLYTHLKPTLTN